MSGTPVTVPLGPGTLKLGPTATATDFSCEVSGGKVTHAYEEIGESRTMLCGTVKPASQTRNDGLAFELENDLGAAGMYAFLHANDLTEVDFEYVPNTVAGAKWAGKIVATLPGEIGADAFGAPIASAVEWAGVGKFTFTPSTAPATV